MSIQETQARVVQVTPLTHSILQVLLAPEHYIAYEAGQYLQLLIGDTTVYYSIANAPIGSHQYELHIRHNPDNPTDQALLQLFRETGLVQLRVPFGICDMAHLDPVKPIVFIAGGTGFAPVKAMIEQLLCSGDTRRVELIWTARTQADLYLDEKVKQWQNHAQQFQYLPLVSSQDKQTPASVLLSRHQTDLKDWQIVISGPFDLVYQTRDQLVEQGVARDHLYSDAFQFEDN